MCDSVKYVLFVGEVLKYLYGLHVFISVSSIKINSEKYNVQKRSEVSYLLFLGLLK